MKLGNLNHRLVLITPDDRAIDVHTESNGRFSADIQAVYSDWNAFTDWAASIDPSHGEDFALTQLGNPTPSPRQIFAIGLNFDEHSREAGYTTPSTPTVFTKFVTSLSDPFVDVELPEGGQVDWEVELVAVIGAQARNVDAGDAWSHIAGLTIGQDISERALQLTGPAPQFSLAKSFPNFGPVGPWLLTPDEFENPDDIELGCSINGVEMQRGRTRDLIHSIPALIEHLSGVLTLLPGDIIFTGTPAGVGMGRQPQLWLQPGDVLSSWAEGLGQMRQRLVSRQAQQLSAVDDLDARVPQTTN